MFRLLIITIFTVSIANGQGVGDLAELETSSDEKLFAVFIHAARKDKDSTKIIIITSLLGRLHIHQQRYPLAEKELLQSLEKIEKLKGDIRVTIKMAGLSIYDTYDFLGELYENTANYRKAEYYYKLSEQFRLAKYGGGSPFRIFNLQNLADFYLFVNHLPQAEVYLRKLGHELAHTRYNSGKLRTGYAIYYKGMTDLSIRLGRLEDAKLFFKKTVKFYATPFASYKGALRRNEGATSELRLLRSKLLMMEGKLDESQSNTNAAIGTVRDSLNLLPEFLRTRTICFWNQHQPEKAMGSAMELLALDLKNLDKLFHFLNEGEKEEFGKHVEDDFNLFASMIDFSDERNPEILKSLLKFRLQTKALLLSEARNLRSTILRSHDSTLITNYHLLSLLKEKESVEVFKKKSRIKLQEISSQIDDLEHLITNEILSKPSLRAPKRISVEDIQTRLLSDEAAIEAVHLKKIKLLAIPANGPFKSVDSVHYMMLVVRKESIDLVTLENGSQLEGRISKYYSNSVKLNKADSILYNNFWKSVDQKINGVNKVYFSGDGVFNQINLNLLNDGSKYLIDKYNIVLLTNLRDISKSGGLLTSGDGVFFGRPLYSFGGSETNKEISTKRALRGLALDDLKTEEFSDLPATEAEVTNASAILKEQGWAVTKWLGKNASENHVKGMSNPKLLHIATHGFFIEDNWATNPMLKSGLIFSGVRNQDDADGEDGILTALEASELKLDSTELVILSACETGLGEVINGEGVYGLQRAFLISGAKNIIMSLWKVDDEATQKLMLLFYKDIMELKNTRMAFIKAQQQLRTEYPEPYYWGAFVLIGN